MPMARGLLSQSPWDPLIRLIDCADSLGTCDVKQLELDWGRIAAD